MPGTPEAKTVFLRAPQFAVVGASKDQTKYGTKVSFTSEPSPAHS